MSNVRVHLPIIRRDSVQRQNSLSSRMNRSATIKKRKKGWTFRKLNTLESYDDPEQILPAVRKFAQSASGVPDSDFHNIKITRKELSSHLQ